MDNNRLVREAIPGLACPNEAEQCYGMEVEMEYVDLENGYPIDWRVVEDGSLRNRGLEFLTPPSTLAQMEALIDTLWEARQGRPWQGGPRCGIHLHMDFTNKPTRHVAAFLAAYACLEPAIMYELCGEEREQNIYCVPYYRAPRDLTPIARYLAEPYRTQVERIQRTCKYSAMYLEPLTRFGTVEFRGAPVYDNAEDVKNLVRFFDNLIAQTSEVQPEMIIELFEEDQDHALDMFAPSLDRVRTEQYMLELDSVGIAGRAFVRTRPEDIVWEQAIPPHVPADVQRAEHGRVRYRDIPEGFLEINPVEANRGMRDELDRILLQQQEQIARRRR